MIAERPLACLDHATLTKLLAGRLPQEPFALAIEHVEACEHCTRAATEQSDCNSIRLLTRDDEQLPGGFEHELECQVVVGNLLVNPPAGREVSSDSLWASPPPRESLGPYRLLGSLGAGGMGTVYLAEHLRLRKKVAIKLLPRDKLLRAGWLDRFNREMTSVAALEHPHVVRALDAGEEDNWHFLVMEHLDGLDLSRVCRRVPELSVGAACDVVRQAALGLSAIHDQGMVHRDIKPSNLFLTQTGVAKILDLGLVLDGESPLSADERLTTVGHLMGTLPYMAREQLGDASSVDHRADIYGLGATLYRLLTGKPPYGSENLPHTIQLINSTDCPKIIDRRVDLPTGLSTLVDRMLSHDREVRPQSAAEVAGLLTPYCDPQATVELIRTALQRNEEVAKSALMASQPPVQIDSSRGRGRSRWPWIAIALLPPTAFLAGILVMLTTDRGTLVIESDHPNVTVKVSQGEQVVQTLQLEQATPTSVHLRSGRYLVELEGVEAGTLEISDSEIAITRNDQSLVRIRTKETARHEGLTKANPVASAKLFHGKPLEDWMQSLIRDQDNETLGQAMQAVTILAETDEEKRAAAKRMLVPARRLGGFILSGRPNSANPSGWNDANNLSGWFMTDLTDWYPKFFPDAGMQGIVDELENGTPESAMACLLLLTPYRSAASQLDRESLTRLNESLRKYADEFESLGRDLMNPTTEQSRFRKAGRYAIQQRLLVLKQLQSEIFGDPQIVEWARSTLLAAQQTLNKGAIVENSSMMLGGMSFPFGTQNTPSPLTVSETLAIRQALAGTEYGATPLMIGALQSYRGDEDAALLQMLKEFADAEPVALAEATIVYLDRCRLLLSHGSSFGGMGGMTPAIDKSLQARGELALHTTAQHHPDPMVALLSLVKGFTESRLPAEFAGDQVEAAFDVLLQRVVLETDDDDPQAVAKLAFATRGLAMRGVGSQEVIEKLLRRVSNIEFDSSTISVTGEKWPEQVDATFEIEQPSDQWSVGTHYVHLRVLVAKLPAAAVPALTGELEKGNDEEYFLPLLILRISEPESDQKPGSTEQIGTSWLEYSQTLSGREQLANLRRALQSALKRIKEEPNDSDDRTALTLVFKIVGITKLLGEPLKEQEFAATTIREYVQSAARQPLQVNDKALDAYLLKSFAEIDGDDQVPLEAILHLAWSSSPLDDELERIIRGLYRSRPDEFSQFFMAALQGNSAEPFVGSANILRSNSPQNKNAPKGVWHAIIESLTADPATREAVVQLLKGHLQSVPNNDFIAEFIRSLQP